MLKAFEVRLGGDRGIAFAKNRAAAKWLAVKSYRDAGFSRRGEWPACKVIRRPDLDARMPAERAHRFFSEEYLPEAPCP